jgi:NADH:ubiquinone oxidoreductase subunit F (NADH-binding)
VTAFLLPPSPVASLDEYLATETVGLGLAQAQKLGPPGTIDEISRSGLRGRGGAGFPTGRKWAGIAAQDAPGAGTHRYLVCNAAEGEPGTFKDRALMRANPYQLVEGIIIAASTIGAREAFVCLKASFETEFEAVTRAVAEMQQAGICTDCQVTVVSGPEEYLYGEEKAMLEVIEGRDPLPRLLPPYIHGLFATAPQSGWEAVANEPGHRGAHGSNPTLVNNVETLSNVPHILARGSDWFRSMGTEQSPGNLVCTVVGDVAAPDVGEVEMGLPLRDVIDLVGSGLLADRHVKAVFSGVSNAVISGDQLAVPLSYEGFQAIGSGMGAGGFIVYDDRTCMIEVARVFSRFLWVESCGQCPPCKLGSGHITAALEHIETGEGTDADLDTIRLWLGQVTDGARCYLATEEAVVVGSILEAFPDELAEHIELGRCPRPRPQVLPKIVDLGGGTVRYDERQAAKQPDWTYT